MIKRIRWQLKNWDWFKLIFDSVFMTLAVISFYSNLLLLMLSWGLFLFFSVKTSYYHKNHDAYYLNAFIDFLNQINSNLCIGMGFDTSIIASAKVLKGDLSYSSKTILKLDTVLKMGIDNETLFEKVCEAFPIYETTLFARMMRISKETGANPSVITGITIDKLYMKHKIIDEIDTILYQKKMEQTILCLAPMFIILFIKVSSPGYLDLMYHTAYGRMAMSFALGLILLMKGLSEHIIKFKV